MKRILSMLLVCLFLLGSASALAEEEVIYSGKLTRMRYTEEEWNRIAEKINANKAEGDPDEVYVFFDDLMSALLALDAGTITFLSLPRCVADYVIAQNPGRYRAEESAGRYVYAMLMRDTDAEFMDALSAAIALLSENGKLAELESAYIRAELPTEGLTLPTIENAPTYRVLVTGDLPPMDYVSADGQADGFNVAFLAALSDVLNVNFEIVTADTGARAIMLMSGRADIVFWAQTSENSRSASFQAVPEGYIISGTYLTQQKVLLYRAD